MLQINIGIIKMDKLEERIFTLELKVKNLEHINELNVAAIKLLQNVLISLMDILSREKL